MRFFICFFLVISFSFSQNQYPKDFFSLPLEIPMELSGNFGELRPNHFHAGFDFKTNQKEGLNVLAAADGYVSRIKISTVGYGKAIYITHPNGYTTVYGHLQKATGAIQNKIEEIQYTEKSYEIEAFFKPNELPVNKRQVIAISGNTGGSEGPHLHFEFRDNKTENIINPFLFGFGLKDTKKPIISSLFVYPIDANSIANESKIPIALNLSLQKDGTYLSEKVLATGRIGFGINSVDWDDVSYNANGTYKTQLISNGTPIFGFEFDQMVFDESRFVNAFIDYYRYKKTHQRVQKLFMKYAYNWSNVHQNVDNGICNVVSNFNGVQRIEVSDFFQNKSTITIPIQYSNQAATVMDPIKTTKYFVKAKVDAIFEKDNFSVSFPAGTFYDDFYLNFEVKNKTLFLHEDTVPVHSNFTITAEDTVSPENEKEKMFFASLYGKKWNYIATKLVGNTFTCRTKTLGQFSLMKDTVAPKINISKSIEGKWLTGQKSLSLNISDEFSGIKTYNCYLNDVWVLFEYEPKLKKITHIFKNNLLLEGTNKLKVTVTDNVGNSTIFETQFNRSQK
ncbi:M23 family metallopeptidase [Flavobacterium sp.]|uniref:M23 family metallopeptidase n=1 Tax=Flavobacterium sp. TaxID=239 RepID=UPI003BC9B58A